jgi:isocitrate lyase
MQLAQYPIRWRTLAQTSVRLESSNRYIARCITYVNQPKSDVVTPPISTSFPADSYQLLPTEHKHGDVEDELFNKQVQEMNVWWASPRYEGIKRPYSAKDVVAKRGTLQQAYPSSLMARKLFDLLNRRAAQGLPVHTRGFIPKNVFRKPGVRS